VFGEVGFPFKAKIRTILENNPAGLLWCGGYIYSGRKVLEHFRLIRNFLSSSNGCKLINHGYRFVKLRKYLCFGLFMQQRKFFSSIKTTAIPEQL